MPDNSSNNKRIAKNSIFLSIRMVIVLLISLYTTRVVLKELGVVDFGVYNVVCGFVTMFAFLNTSMSNGIQRFFNYEYGKNGEEGANRVFCTSVFIQALLALIVVIIVELIGLWYLHNKMVIPSVRMDAAEWIFQFSVISFILGIMQAPFSAAVTAHERFNFYAFVGILDAVLKLAIVFLLKIIPVDNLVLYGSLLTLVSLINFLLFVIYSKKNFAEIKFNFYYDSTLFRGMLGFSGWNLFGSLSGVMKEQGINLVINFFFGPVVNAARGIASQINSGIQGFVNNVLTPVRPQVVQSYAKGDVTRTMTLTYSVSKLCSYVFLLMAIPVSFEIDFILKIWLGENVPVHTAAFTIIVLCTTLFEILNGATSTVVHASGVMKLYQLSGGIIGICSVPLAYFLLLLYQRPELALLSVFFCSSIRHIIGLFIVRNTVGMSVLTYTRKVFVPIISVCLFSIAVLVPIHLFLPSSYSRLTIVFLFGVGMTILSIYLFGLESHEKGMIKDLIGRIKGRFVHSNIDKSIKMRIE